MCWALRYQRYAVRKSVVLFHTYRWPSWWTSSSIYTNNQSCNQAIQELITGYSACMTDRVIYISLLFFLAYPLPTHSHYLQTLLHARILSKLSILISSTSDSVTKVLTLDYHSTTSYAYLLCSHYPSGFLVCWPWISIRQTIRSLMVKNQYLYRQLLFYWFLSETFLHSSSSIHVESGWRDQ